ncbi:MAG TPA: Mur ligase family protein [Candidatus Andersenbacteria bacterium]|nr:Mur ligase family protein [Candidatus Andersenbacteria bacterium]
MSFIQQLKNIGHFFEARFWRIVYGIPDKGMRIFGVTGTNGKTTTCYLLTSVLAEAHGREHVGMLTTVAFRIGEQEEINTTKMTTLPSRKVFAYLARMKKQGVEYVVLETTSHALHQHRISGIQFDGAIILNIAREHLDYHETLEQYARAKEKIIRYLRIGAPIVGKQDDDYVRPMLDRAEQRGLNVIRMTNADIEKTETKLAGSINKENACAVTLLARELRIPYAMIQSGIDKVTSVPGRMEKFVTPQGITIVIDYAVTPDALERLYADVKKDIKEGSKIFGTVSAAGLRDRGKRADMARAVAKYADKIVVTREDPWTEPEEQIFQDLEKGLQDSPVSWQRIVDRKEALKSLLQEAKAGDVVVATGKGAERGMGIEKEVIPWNEREVIEGIMKELSSPT